MNNLDRLYYIKKRIISGRNIFLMLIIICLFIISFICLSSICTLGGYLINYTSNGIEPRAIEISNNIDEDKKNEILKISHVQNVISCKFRRVLGATTEDYKDSKLTTLLEIYPIASNNKIKITKGNKISGNNQIIIPEKFYPYDNYFLEEKEDKILEEKIIDGRKLIGKRIELTFKYNNLENNKIIETTLTNEFEIIGTYNTTVNKLQLNNCFISDEDFDKYCDNIGSYRTYGTKDNLKIEVHQYEKMVLLDNGIFSDYVLSKLKEIGVNGNKVHSIDAALYILTLGPLFLLVIVLIAEYFILKNFIKNKIINRKNNIGILMSVGYPKKEIITLDVIENSIIIVSSFICALLIYTIVFNYIKHSILTNFIYYSVNISYPTLLFVFVLMTFIVINMKLVFDNINKLMKEDIVKVLNGGE